MSYEKICWLGYILYLYFVVDKCNIIYIHIFVYFNISLIFYFKFFIVGWASWQNVQGFGETATAKSQILNLIKSIRTVARGIDKKLI